MSIKEKDTIRYVVKKIGKINAVKARAEVLVETLSKEEKAKYLKKIEDKCQEEILKYQRLLNLCMSGKLLDWKI